jgi:hypothetical protein
MADFQTIADAHIGADELSDRISVSSSLDLNPSTPGGAFVKKWEASGYSTDANTLMAAATSAMGNGSKTSQEAAKMALRTGQITAAACAVTGVGTAIAPLCGVIGGAFGAISAYIFGRVNEAEAELRQVWAQADISVGGVALRHRRSCHANSRHCHLRRGVRVDPAGCAHWSWILRHRRQNVGSGHVRFEQHML